MGFGVQGGGLLSRAFLNPKPEFPWLLGSEVRPGDGEPGAQRELSVGN